MSEGAIRRRKQKTGTKKKYNFLARLLLFNNLTFALLWFCCLGRWALLFPLVGRRFLPGAIAEFFQNLTTCSAVSEFLVMCFLVRPPRKRFLLKLSKILNQLFMIWLIIFRYPKITKHEAYSLFLVTVSTQEMFKYLYQWLMEEKVLRPIKKNVVFVGFPLQRISEMVLIMLSLKFIDSESPYESIFGQFLKVLLVFYVPGSYMIFRYLWKTR